MGIRGRRTATKNPPILSHEFVIQNHADIVSCVAMVFVIGLMFQLTSPIASVFIALHHNATGGEAYDPESEPEPTLYTYGWKDLCLVFFYFLISIVMHAILQEYVLDKVNRKLHLSKVKHSKFNESGQLVAFYLVSVLWGGNIIFRENLLLNLSSLWDGYPHSQLTFMTKFFFIAQLSYWLHCFPELYFQKMKREEWAPRIQLASLYIAFIGVAYLLNFTRVATCLLVLHYISESLFHAARALTFSGRQPASIKVFMSSNVVFILVRLASIILSVLTFWYGLALSSGQGWNPSEGNFNTQFVRINALVGVCLLQAWLMWNFLTFHLRKRRERMAEMTVHKNKPAKKAGSKNKGKGKDHEVKKAGSEDDVNELPEVDQNTKKNLRSRKGK